MLPFFMLLLCTFGILQFKKLGKFLAVEGNPNLPKHTKKIMMSSLAKYLTCLFALIFCTYRIFIYPMIFVWGCAMVFIYKYIKLWKYHKYSVLFLICISGVMIMVSILLSPFIRPIVEQFLKG